MKKKKILSVIAAVVVVASLAIGSLAYFTSKESVTNHFETSSIGDEGNGSGIRIDEKFDVDKAKETLPGDVVSKEVAVTSKTTYKQLIRVKLTPQWNGALNTAENNKLIKLNLSENSDWVDGGDGYYYYIKVLDGKATTSNVLDSVTLSTDAKKDLVGKSFDVIVDAESIQATENAFNDTWRAGKNAEEVQGKLPNDAIQEAMKALNLGGNQKTKDITKTDNVTTSATK